MATARPLAGRFHSKWLANDSGCWIWHASKSNKGYGVIGFGNRVITAHRASWMIHHGDIPAGKWVLHTCDVRACVNPAHLYLGTIHDNARDLWERGTPCARIRENITPEVEAKRIRALPRGGAHHRSAAKITADTALLIYNAIGSQRFIAEAFGVTQQTVSNIKTRKTWGVIHGQA